MGRKAEAGNGMTIGSCRSRPENGDCVSFPHPRMAGAQFRSESPGTFHPLPDEPEPELL